MLESILVYSILFTIMVFCCISVAGKEEKYVGWSGEYQEGTRFMSLEMIILMLSFAFVFGCRWGVGRDYFRYLYAYMGDVPERFEYLFRTISDLLKRVGAHYSVYFGIWALMDIFMLYYTARNFKFIFPYIAFFLIFGFYYLSMMNAIRQHVAAFFFMISITYIDQKKILKYYLCFFIAVLFHRLSLILFVFYPLLRLKDDWFKSISLQMVLFVLAVIISFNSELVTEWIEVPFEWLSEKIGYQRYQYDLLTDERFDRNKFGSGTGLGIWVNIFKTVPIILLSQKMKDYYNSTFINMLYSLFFLGVLLSLLFGNSIILNRITYFFVDFQIIIYSLFVYFCFDTKKQGYQLIGAMLLLIHIPLFINILLNPNSTAQYLFFWQSYAY